MKVYIAVNNDFLVQNKINKVFLSELDALQYRDCNPDLHLNIEEHEIIE